MFRKILIANRGEIAIRIMRTCRELGIAVATIHSEADANALHVTLSPESHPVGPAPVKDSYLNIERIIAVARAAGAEAIHPGYGLLSENAAFARRCAEAGIVFIGPKPEAIAAMALKVDARRIVAEAGVAVIPGSDTVGDVEEARAWAAGLGYPLLVKASAGGGGIGMQVVGEERALEKAIQSCEARAKAYFGDPTLYLEKYIPEARHIEVQVFGDGHGNLIYLNERECSVQRRHQKLIEEAPAPGLSATRRARMGEAAVRAARAVDYTNAGTLEFLVDREGNSYFLEMNTRLQVEHPVTEMTTGLDLVALQLKVAAGERLPIIQQEVRLDGHAVECRLYAEDPRTFYPSPGTITAFEVPSGEGLRLDAGVVAGQVMTPYYDPLMAKLIAWGPDRALAVRRLADALDAVVISGVKSNVPLLRRVLSEQRFLEGALSTRFLETLG